MSKSGTEAIIYQSADKVGVASDRITELFAKPGLSRVRIAVAYARWEGIGLISNSIEALLNSGGSFQTIFGAANGVTTTDSLLYGLYLKELYPDQVCAAAVEDKYSNSIFHPKIFEFEFPDCIIAIVGSNNLTGGGMLRNTEVGVMICTPRGSKFEEDLSLTWSNLRKLASPITPALIRSLMVGERAGSESDDGEAKVKNDSKPFLKTTHKLAQKPLFKKVLDLKSPEKKAKILSKFDTLSTKPTILHLQILPFETGGSKGRPGYQVQLPVATLGAYFGVGVDQKRIATFHFSGISEPIKVNLTHNPNNTHRVRLRPILNIKRPAILRFERVAADIYNVSSIQKSKYNQVLKSKCTEQRRKGSRRWGME